MIYFNINKMNAIVFFDPNCSGNSNIKGTIKIHQCSPKSPVLFHVNLTGLSKDTVHAIHVHEYGNLTKGCMSTGSHFNPTNETHGSYLYPDEPRHVGDLINNIQSSKKGVINYKFWDHLTSLSGPMSIVGRAIVIHEGKDDLGRGGLGPNGRVINKKVHKESLKTGNAGGRMACGIIGRDKSHHFT